MGRQKVLRTYGHHRKRCIVSTETVDIFSGDRSKHQLFNTSSSESGLGPSDSLDSFDSLKSGRKEDVTGRRAKNKALLRLKEEEENCANGRNKRKRQPAQKKGKLFISDKDTCSSSDCASPAQKRVTRHALQDVSNDCKKQMAKRQPTRRNPGKPKPEPAPPTKNQSSVNFSEFDDYSLVISDSPPDGGKTRDKQGVHTNKEMGTSTPCSLGVSRVVDIHAADISVIHTLNDSISVTENKDNPSPSSIASSPFFPSQENLSSRLSDHLQCFTDDGSRESEESYNQRNLEKLEESFASLRVGGRRLRKRTEKVDQRISPERSSPLCTSDYCSPEDDKLALECKVRVQRFKESLLRSVATASEMSQSDMWDASCSLFDSSARVQTTTAMKVIPQNSKEKPGSRSQPVELISDCGSDSESDHDLESADDLSAIVEDGEEEGEKSDDCAGDMTDDQSCSVVLDSSREGSPVRYLLTSVSCVGEEEEEEEVSAWTEGNSSILCGRKTPEASSLTRSFAEVLTPPRAKAASSDEPSPRQKVLQQCGQDEPLSFSQIIPVSVLKKCVKIGEGVYGEVFRTNRYGQSVALKIIPIEGNFEVNDEPQKTFEEILPEIVISNELSRLREGEENNTNSFCPVRSVSLVQGQYPPELLKQWDLFHERKSSENDRPDVFGDEQLFIVFEFADGGCDLDGCKLKSAAQAVSVLQQVACALAVAEEVLSFEHRDLHVGNVLVQPTHQGTNTLTLNGTPIFVDTQGIHVNIIDFTLSRLTKDGCTVFCDLATDDTLFEGKGDYQFDIYRMMKAENKNEWKSYHPSSNVMWLHYLCDKLIHHKRFQETDRSHREALKRLRQAYGALLDYTSAAHFVSEDAFFDS